MEWSQWLKGGPFLEISFLFKLKEDKKQTIQDIINKLSKLTNKVEIVDNNLDEKIDFFDKGYSYDEEDPQSIKLHSFRLSLYVYFSRKRKATLQIDIVSSNALMVHFLFYGAEFDVPEWDQIGIKKEEFAGFTSLLKELYLLYEFKIGGIAVEEDILELFGFIETYPNECYRYENLSPDYFLKEPSYFINIIWSEKYKQISNIPYNYTRVDKGGIFIETGSFYG